MCTCKVWRIGYVGSLGISFFAGGTKLWCCPYLRVLWEVQIQMKAVQNDMTSGSPMRIILNFTLPIFIGNVFQQFYNMADAVIVGKFVGTKPSPQWEAPEPSCS